jgi:hypothetical protein
MNVELEDYYLKHPEPFQGCLLALKQMIMNVDDLITHERKYQIPFFCYKGLKLAFLWMNRKKLILGFVTDKKILPSATGVKLKDWHEMIQIDPNADLPKEMIAAKIQEQISRYETARKDSITAEKQQ